MIIYEIHKTYKIWSVELIFTGSRFLPTTISEWNVFPIDIRNLETLRAFNTLLDRKKFPTK